MYPNPNDKLSYITEDTVYFFSHAYDPLNNWSAHRVRLWGELFSTVEHGFHFRKFSETAPEIAAQILEAPSPWAAMQIERTHREQRRKDWQAVKDDIMLELIMAKVEQNDDVRDCLVGTADLHIVENSPWDSYWGCGKDGKGKNRMGK
ncbi:MAG: hypothetical protein K0S68_622, partial [Candidatus Saccharibacteria bacterium]|nr:hypothetical protein [Candidatus Saccharibacteria bacterium]